MQQSPTSANHKKQLALLINHLDADGWNVRMLDVSEHRPYECINVAVISDTDQDQVLWNMELSFLPIAETDLADVSILQCFIPLANNFEAIQSSALAEAIVKINTKLPLVGFGFMEDFSLLYYKCNLMLSNDGDSQNGVIVSNALAMISYLVSSFTGTLAEVASGEKSPDNAINEMPFKDLF